MSDDAPILVTGASGYIALHVVQQLLEAGHTVRGTLRNPARETEIRQALGGTTATDRLTFVVVDLNDDAGWRAAVDGCQFAVHMASPLPLALPKNHDDLVVPAREGALRLLRAADEVGVRRVVMTSSVAAVSAGGQRAHGGQYNEDDWSDTEGGIDAYSKSKTLAERAAWDFVADRPLELVAINPSVVLGPNLTADYSASVEVVRKLLAREVPGLPRLGWNMVDVRDVAAAHVAALTAPAAAGRRYICSEDFYWMTDVANILVEHLKGSGRRIPTRRLPNWLVRSLALFDPAVRRVAGDLGRHSSFDTSAIRRDLAWQPRPMARTITDTADSLIAHNVV